jgi:hypothetical protein
MTGNKFNSFAAAAGTVLLHSMAASRLFAWDDLPRAPAVAAVMQVRIVASAAAPRQAAPAATGGEAQSAASAQRDAVYFHFPHEVDRPLIVLRDRSGDADITLEQTVLMHLFVDAAGRVVRMEFAGEAPPLAVQAQLRLAFATMEFLPALKGGRAVPARMKIELLQQPEGE